MFPLVLSVKLPKKDLQAANHRLKKLGFAGADRTIFLCVDRKEAGCASGKEMAASWKHLKRRVKEVNSEHGCELKIARIKMQCCGICKAGPIALVMPDNVWYGRCTAEVLDQIIDEHLINGKTVKRFTI